MCFLSGGKINPLIGAAGISAYPMAARVVQAEGIEGRQEELLAHARDGSQHRRTDRLGHGSGGYACGSERHGFDLAVPFVIGERASGSGDMPFE